MITTIWKSIFSPVGFCGCLLGSLLLTGCGTTPPSTYVDSPGIAGTNAPRALGSELNDPQVIKPGDTITIMYFDVPGGVPPQEVEIRPEGTVTLLLNQEFKAAGLTPMQLEKTIRDRYVPSFYRQMTVTAYPNPASDRVHVYFSGNVTGVAEIILSDLTGKAVRSQRAEVKAGNLEETVIDVTGLPSGIYLAVITNGSEKAVQKIVVSR